MGAGTKELYILLIRRSGSVEDIRGTCDAVLQAHADFCESLGREWHLSVLVEERFAVDLNRAVDTEAAE